MDKAGKECKCRNFNVIVDIVARKLPKINSFEELSCLKLEVLKAYDSGLSNRESRCRYRLLNVSVMSAKSIGKCGRFILFDEREW